MLTLKSVIKDHLEKVHFLNQQITFYDNILNLIYSIYHVLPKVLRISYGSGPCCQRASIIKGFDLQHREIWRNPFSIPSHPFL